MNLHFFISLLSIGLFVNEASSSCPEAKFIENLNSVQKCISIKAAENVFGNGQICKIIDNVFVTCAELLRECLNEEEYRQFLDGQITNFLQTMPDQQEEARKCSTVQKSEESSIRTNNSAAQGCTGDKIQQLITEESQCSQKGAKDLADKLQASEEVAKATICDGADQILKDCFEKIKPCFPASEIDNFKGLQRETFRQLLSSLTTDAKNKIDLSECTPASPSTS